jgi:hypothetical protein
VPAAAKPPPAVALVEHAAWPHPQVISGCPALPSQKALQYLLSGAALQTQEGCAHLSFV